MAGRNLSVSIHFFILLFISATAIVAVNGGSGCEQECGEIRQKCQGYQTKVLNAWKEISVGNQLCAPPTRLENQLKKERAESRLLEKRSKDLIAVILTALASDRQTATVPHTEVYGKVNDSVDLSCESGGQPLIACSWERSGGNEQREIIVVDEHIVKNGGRSSVRGITSNPDGLQHGICRLNIERMQKNNFGHWSCTLVAQSGTFYVGNLTVENELESLYFGTDDGVKRYSFATTKVQTVANSSEEVVGVAVDWLRGKIYWSVGNNKVFRANRDGTRVETVLNTEKYGGFRGLALDCTVNNVGSAGVL